MLAYGEFESFAVAAEDYAAPLADSLGIDLQLVSYPLTATDFLPVLTRAADANPDAIIVAAAGSACAPIMTTYQDLGIDAQLYLVGACADEEIIRAAGGAHEGVLFNTEGPPLSVETVEDEMFLSINELYANDEAGGAGTVGLRGFMNLYALMDGLGADGVTHAAVLETAEASADVPSFWGHAYTCDEDQIEGLPSLCAPQQSLFRVEAPGDNVIINEDWYDTVALFAQAG